MIDVMRIKYVVEIIDKTGVQIERLSALLPLPREAGEELG